MTTMAPPALLTAAEFLALPNDGQAYELEEGRLVEVAGASWLSSTVALTIGALLYTFVKAHQLGKVSGADLGVKLSRDPDTVRVPNVAFVRRERLPNGRGPRGFLDGAPDLAVEVLSPSDSFTRTLRKVRQYLATGAVQVWVIDPEDRSAVVFHADGRLDEYDADGQIPGGDLLPGFTLSLADIWEEVVDEVIDSEPTA